MIIGTGIDVVDLERFTALMEKNPRLIERLFVPAEREKNMRSLAARFAAKEAAAKALRAPAGMVWQHCWVENNADGAPYFVFDGTVLARAQEIGVNRIHLTMTHDGPVSIAQVTAECLSPEQLALLRTTDPGALGILD